MMQRISDLDRPVDIVLDGAQIPAVTFPGKPTVAGSTPVAMRDVWLPANGPRVALIRWLVTEWCNYRCSYCPQTHARRAPKGGGMTAHAFDNFPVEAWQESFKRHFGDQRLSLVITGGEPMVDRRNMTAMLNFLTKDMGVECIRIDTNAWWRPDQFPDLDRSKIILMCTYHPSQTDEEEFKERIISFRENGFTIGMVNYVMDDHNVDSFVRRRAEFRQLGFVLHPNPIWVEQGDKWVSRGNYNETVMKIMESALPEVDYLYRTGSANPNLKACSFPAVGYELDYRGNVSVGCFGDLSGSFFAEALPQRPVTPVPCPHTSCSCLDKYSFLDGVERNLSLNPLREYSRALQERF